MSIAEGVQAIVSYKAYASGAITAGTLATSSSDLGASGATNLRRVSSSLKLGKDTYQSNEVLADRQISDFRHGIKRVSGSLSGELSPATYFDFFEASARGTKASAISATQSDFTSVTGSASGSSFTFAAGNPHTKGFRVGSIVNFTNLSVSGNNATNFLITAMGGTTNRTWTVYPAPSDQTTDSAFTVAEVGKSIVMPSSSFVSRKFGFEHDFNDVDVAHLFTECRIGGFKLNLPATGMATVEFPVMGRDMELYTAGSAPFFTSPTAANTNGLFAAVNGALIVGGTQVGVVTGLSIDLNLNPSAPAVVGQNFVPEIFLDKANLTGQMTALLQDNTLITDFKNETEISIVAYLTTTSAVNSPAMSVTIPRVKFSDGAVAVQGGAEQTITLPFQALKYATAGSGFDATTFRIQDTQAS